MLLEDHKTFPTEDLTENIETSATPSEKVNSHEEFKSGNDEYKSIDREELDDDPRTEDEKEGGKFNLDHSKKNYGTDLNYELKIIWRNAFAFVVLHLIGVYAVYLFFTKAKIWTPIYFFFMVHFTGLGITAAAHRLWAHRTYKARTPLKVLLLILQTITGQHSLWYWVREHRLHHRYSDTDGDPHNAQRGWFFSHMGWLMTKNHPLIRELGRTIDLSDIESDPLLMFQKKYYGILHTIFGLVPVAIPILLWNEDVMVSIITCYILRYVYQLQVTWSLNSFAHTFGMRPYDKSILPVESKALAIFTLGEGWHNFHHIFPWDYRLGEWGGMWNITASFINFMHRLGQAYDLKMASNRMIKARMQRTGDGTYDHYNNFKTVSKQL